MAEPKQWWLCYTSSQWEVRSSEEKPNRVMPLIDCMAEEPNSPKAYALRVLSRVLKVVWKSKALSRALHQ